MLLYKKENCSGCGVCALKCPKKCINMERDTEGFIIPVIDKEKCINCGICEKICPFNNYNKYVNKDINRACYAIQLKDKNILNKCASGGAFAGLALEIIKNNGVVVGACEDELNNLHFEIVKEEKDIQKILGSKYYQCELNEDVFRKIREMAKEKVVLFGGTPCQVAAVKAVTNKSIQNNIITVDIICQGVPSKKCVESFRKAKEKRKDIKIKKHSFRSKDKYLYKNYLAKYEFADGSVEYIEGDNDLFCSSFQRQIMLRESCYNCKFAQEKRTGDITLGDIWDFDETDNFNIDKTKGVSVAVCNTQNGKEYIEKNEEFLKQMIEEQVALRNNIPFHRPVKRPGSRSVSYKLLDIIGPKATLNICCPKYVIKKVLKRFTMKG